MVNQTQALQALQGSIDALRGVLQPGAPAPGQLDLLVQTIHEELLEHLKVHVPKTCTWEKKIYLLEPWFWVVVAHLKVPEITRLDIVKEMGLPGDFTMIFIRALEMHFPEITVPIKNALSKHFEAILRTYILSMPALRVLMAANPVDAVAIKALAVQLVRDVKDSVKSAREVMLHLDVLSIENTYGAKAAAVYGAIAKDPNENHLGNAMAMKQAIYQCTKDTSATSALPLVPAIAGGDDGLASLPTKACSRCGMAVPAGGFREHNKLGVCPKKGVNKPRPLKDRRPPPKK